MSKETTTATRAIVREANQWLVRLHDGDLPSSEEAAFADWLRESPVHVREYLRAEALYSALEGIDAGQRIDVDAILAADSSNVVKLDHSGAVKAPSRPRSRSRRRYLASMAAGIALLAVIAGGLWYAEQPVRYETGLGEQRRLVLDDGSVVDMNTQTELHVRIDDGGRFIELLQGEALFSVVKDPHRPFVVDGELATVRALGTQFNVYRQSEQILVTVIEGRVAVDNKDSPQRRPGEGGGDSNIDHAPMELAAGDLAEIVARAPIRKTTANTEKTLAWRERRLIFENQPLTEVVAEFNRYNRRQLVIDHPELGAERISAVFDADQPDALVRFLTQNTPIAVIETDDARLILSVNE